MDALMYKNLIPTFFVEKKFKHSRPERLQKCFEYVMKFQENPSEAYCEKIISKIASFETTFMQKWRGSKCTNEEQFKEEYQSWVHRSLELPPPSQQTGRSRKQCSFKNLSGRTQGRRAAELVNTSGDDVEALLLASAQAGHNSGNKDLEHVLRLLCKDPKVATEIRDLLKAKKYFVKPKKLNPLRGLTHLLDNRLSKSQYINTRLLAKESGANIFPAYQKITKAKEECRPPADCLKINDVSAALPLQALLNHTVYRLLLLQELVIMTLEIGDNNEITVMLQVKWGGDGSSGQSRYNLKYVNAQSTRNSDADLFATTLVPLRITTVDDDKNIIWDNATPQSPRWCRPLRLHFAKETQEFTSNELQSVEDEIKVLTPFTTTIAGKQIKVIYELYLTMIDGKVLAVKTKTKSYQRCCICKATPRQFNNLTNMAICFKPHEGTLNYGISVLHLWIRSFEWLLHISYRIEVKTWQMRGSFKKAIMKKRKLVLQQRFIDEMHMRVDFPSSGGSGNTNNGPVARKAFSDTKLLAKVLDLDADLIKKVSIILIALSCQLPLDPDLFQEFCEETAHYYVSKYKWFPLPPSIHKVLIHSKDIMLANDLPLGVLAEDAAESCNKLYRHNRQFHARKRSRLLNLMDVFNRALDSSDPIVASFGLQKRQNSRKKKSIPSEVLQLLKKPDATGTEVEEMEIEDTEMEGTEETEEIEEDDLDDFLGELSANLEGLSLPEDPFYEIDDDDDDDEEWNGWDGMDEC